MGSIGNKAASGRSKLGQSLERRASSERWHVVETNEGFEVRDENGLTVVEKPSPDHSVDARNEAELLALAPALAEVALDLANLVTQLGHGDTQRTRRHEAVLAEARRLTAVGQ